MDGEVLSSLERFVVVVVVLGVAVSEKRMCACLGDLGSSVLCDSKQCLVV